MSLKTGRNTPINEVPPEVLANIFEAGMVWKPNGFTPDNYIAPQRIAVDGYAPMVYLRVCRYWREVALSTSSLWTSFSSAEFRHKVAIIPAMKFWLDRSSPTAPLDLQLRFQDNFPPLYANNILRFLTTEVRRWRSMSIELNLSLAQEFAALLERTQDLCQLEELEIQLLTKGVPAAVSQRILAQIPLLKSLRRFTWVTEGGRESRDHAFRQLRALAGLDDITIYIPSLFDECVTHLTQCISATKVRLYDETCHYYPLQKKPALPIRTLPRLTFLTLTRFWDALELLDYVTLPSLEYLKIRNVEEQAAGHNLTILRNFLERSKCPLRSFTILGTLSDSTLTDYLLFHPIRSIPKVQFIAYCPKIEKRMLKILETYPDADTAFPPITCWVPDEIWASTSIGWGGHLEMGNRLLFSWTAGKLELTADKYLLDCLRS